MKFTERQWEVIDILRKRTGSIWSGAMNKKVVDALIKKGMLKIDKKLNVTLTELGKTIKRYKKKLL